MGPLGNAYGMGVHIESALGDVPPREAIEKAVHALSGGFLVAIPTDTVYGLAADVSYTGAADRLFAIKQRSRSFELPVLVADIEQARSISVGLPPIAERLMEKFWPGALTIVVPRHPDFVADLGSDDETVGIRCPNHIVPRLLCEEIGPLATTSANLHKEAPRVTAQEVADMFPEGLELILDGGPCDGRSSTVVDVTGSEPKLLREGDVSWDDIRALID